MKAYKGFDKNMKCRDMQYEVGKTYETTKAVRCTNNGYHACENPLDVFRYYPLVGSKFHEVECEGQIDKKENEDSKFACSKITIGAEIGIKDMVKASVEFVFSKVKSSKIGPSATSGNYSHSATSGNHSHSSTSGDYSHSATSGNHSHSATSGYYSHSATSGDSSHSATSGYYSHSATSGNHSHSATSGYSSHSCVEGKNSIACAFGRNSKVKGMKGAFLVLTQYDDDYNVIGVKVRKVDGKHIKPNTWYELVDGKFTEADK